MEDEFDVERVIVIAETAFVEGWNAAIEAAAKIADDLDYYSLSGPEIRKLKK